MTLSASAWGGYRWSNWRGVSLNVAILLPCSMKPSFQDMVPQTTNVGFEFLNGTMGEEKGGSIFRTDGFPTKSGLQQGFLFATTEQLGPGRGLGLMPVLFALHLLGAERNLGGLGAVARFASNPTTRGQLRGGGWGGETAVHLRKIKGPGRVPGIFNGEWNKEWRLPMCASVRQLEFEMALLCATAIAGCSRAWDNGRKTKRTPAMHFGGPLAPLRQAWCQTTRPSRAASRIRCFPAVNGSHAAQETAAKSPLQHTVSFHDSYHSIKWPQTGSSSVHHFCLDRSMPAGSCSHWLFLAGHE